VHVDGFSDTVHRTGVGNGDFQFGFMRSITAQAQWRADFESEKKRLHDLEGMKTSAGKEKDDERKRELEERIENEDAVAFLPAPVGWPCFDDEDDDVSGLPKLSIVMQVCSYP
jgi:hypothetical protein